MSNVLVTGANGQLGQCLQDLKDQDKNINFTFVSSAELDITEKKDVDIILSEGNFDYCVNCAAYTKVDKAEEEVELAYQVNAEAVKYLAEACKHNDVTFIHISTDFVFDGKKDVPYTEEDVPNPINIYGASKLKGEKYIQDIMKNYFIIRTSWVYSEYGNNFVKTMLMLSDEKDEISVVQDQIGGPTYAKDLANFLVDLIKIRTDKYGIYNFSNLGAISWYEFAKEIFRFSRINILIKPINSIEYPTLASRPPFSALDGSKAGKLTSGKFHLNWEYSLYEYMNKRNKI